MGTIEFPIKDQPCRDNGFVCEKPLFRNNGRPLYTAVLTDQGIIEMIFELDGKAYTAPTKKATFVQVRLSLVAQICFSQQFCRLRIAVSVRVADFLCPRARGTALCSCIVAQHARELRHVYDALTSDVKIWVGAKYDFSRFGRGFYLSTCADVGAAKASSGSIRSGL